MNRNRFRLLSTPVGIGAAYVVIVFWFLRPTFLMAALLLTASILAVAITFFLAPCPKRTPAGFRWLVTAALAAAALYAIHTVLWAVAEETYIKFWFEDTATGDAATTAPAIYPGLSKPGVADGFRGLRDYLPMAAITGAVVGAIWGAFLWAGEFFGKRGGD